LSNAISFFQRIGIYDVVLPFLLTFTITFAIFEKSKILGTEVIEEKVYTKKNLNAMAAFVIAFMVIASGKLVETITRVSANVVVLILLGIFFLLLLGTFYAPKEKEPIALEKGWKTTFTVIMFIGVVVVFLDAIRTEVGQSWLDVLLGYLGQFWTSTAVASIILIIFLIVFVVVMVREPKEEKEEEKKK
jgi:hypothetical protein